MPVAAVITRRRLLERVAAAATGAAVARPAAAAIARESGAVTIVDAHVHVWKNDPRFPWASDLKSPPQDDATPQMLLKRMHEAGVERTVIVHVIYYRWDCRYAVESVRAHSDRFMGVCRVDPQSATAVADLNHWVAEGLRGVRLSPAAGPEGDWIGDREKMDTLWGRASELGVPMCILCPIERIPDVDKVIERFADRLDVCIDHMADSPIERPDELKKLLALARHQRVYVKISHLWSLSREPYPYRDTHQQVRRLYDAFGPQRLMWGTDWPIVERYCTYEQALALYRDEIPFFSDEDRKWILGQTALKLWPATTG